MTSRVSLGQGHLLGAVADRCSDSGQNSQSEDDTELLGRVQQRGGDPGLPVPATATRQEPIYSESELGDIPMAV
jgi:hypothetical protein